jgi:hypothetical protein
VLDAKDHNQNGEHAVKLPEGVNDVEEVVKISFSGIWIDQLFLDLDALISVLLPG